MAVNLNLPSRQTGTAEQQLNGLYSYLYQLVEALNVTLNRDTTQQKVLYKAGGGNVGEDISGLPVSTVQEYQNLKALIIKTATEVTSTFRKIVTEMSGEYVAQSEFGTYSEFLNNKISQSAEGYFFEWDSENRITTTVASFDDYLAESNVYLRLGIVKHNDDGTVESGIIVGKNFQKVTVDDKEYITSKDVYALFTAEEISFWQDGVMKSKLSLTGLVTTQAYVNDLIANKITADKIDVKGLFAAQATIEALNAVNITGNESLKLLVEALYTIKVIDGQLAQADCLEGQTVRVFSTFSPVQGGSGTASPDNVRAISGRTAAHLTRCGKNLWGGDEITIEQSVDHKLATPLQPGTYTVSGSVESTDTDAATALFGFYLATSKKYQYARFRHDGTQQSYTVTLTEPVSHIRLNAADNVANGAGDTATWRNVQVEVGSEATDYEPVQETAYSVSFGRTVYGGELDWAAGKLTESRVCLTFDGTENWKTVSSGSTLYYYLVLGKRDYAKLSGEICSHFTRATITSSNTAVGIDILNSGVADECRLCVRPGVSGVTDLATWKAYLAAQKSAGTPVQVCFELTEPVALELQPQLPACAEGLNTVYTDLEDGRIEFGHDSLAESLQSQINLLPGQITLAVTESKAYTDEREEHLQSQIDLVPGKISLAVTETKEYADDAVSTGIAAGIKAGSFIEITQDKVQISSKTTSISIPSDDTTDGAEIVSIGEEGLRTTELNADEIHSDSVVGTVSGGSYTPANAGEMQALLNGLTGRSMTGNININASAVTGGSFVIKGVRGYGVLLITGGTMNSLTAQDCTVMVRCNNTVFESGGTAVTVCDAWMYLSAAKITADEGVYAYYGARVIMNGCTGDCGTVLRASSGSVVTVAGATCPTGKLGDVTAAEVYSTVEFAEAAEAPAVSAVSTVTIPASATHTWGGDWLNTNTFGTALYQGATGGGELRRGCMWFDTAAISGKTIVSATLTLKRVSGIGGGGSVAIGIYGTTATGASGEPAVGTKYAQISLANGASGSVDVTAAVQALADGTIKGLMIYDGRTDTFHSKNYTYGYCKVYGTGSGVPSLNVTYK